MLLYQIPPVRPQARTFFMPTIFFLVGVQLFSIIYFVDRICVVNSFKMYVTNNLAVPIDFNKGFLHNILNKTLNQRVISMESMRTGINTPAVIMIASWQASSLLFIGFSQTCVL